jgi:hydrogenase expression/formation protein HypC
MCLAVPGKVESLSGDTAEIDFSGLKRKASVLFIPDVKIGDFVLVHAGFAIQKVDKDAAKETIRIFKELQ